ncbi:MAG: hypothetical protein HY807_00390 [Nitrospirae bacterium]|nr:hypothetical protein [Nitrospirota bacterium]
MRRCYAVKFILLFLFIFTVNENGLAWDDKVTHKLLSKYAADSSVLRLCNNVQDITCDYLKKLGFDQGLLDILVWDGSSTIKQGKIENWIQEGAELEDDGSKWEAVTGKARFNNHFHNPLKTWTEAGLDDTVLFIPYSGDSSLLWAQNSIKQENSLGGDWSWQKTREDFYVALTGKNFAGVKVATTKAERDMYFAKTFRGLGQQMHLIQDAAQPDHVRNDAHPFNINKDGRLNIEVWAAEKYFKLEALKVFIPETNIKFPALPAPSTLTLDQAYYDSNLTPSALFIDTDQYNADDPSQFFRNSLATSQSIGLAEYTNSNFASPDTIFKEDLAQTDPHYFPYPNKLSTNLQELISKNILPETVTTEDGVQQPTLYIKKEKDGEIIDHFVKPKYTTTSRLDYIGGEVHELDFYQDEAVYEEYAKLLLPRAVGYSAGLLNYFFRGDITLEFDSDAGYGYVIVNNTNEEMKGMFEIYYDDASNQRHRLWYGDLFVRGNNKSSTINFDSPASPKEQDKYVLVFNGRIGSEYDAVAGKVVAMPGMNLIRAHFIVFRDRDSKIRDNLTGQYKYPASIDWPFAGSTYEESGDDRSGYYDTQSILMLTAATRTVPEDWGYDNNIQYYWKVEQVPGQAKLVQQGTEPGDRRLYHKAVINVDGHPFTVNRMERTTWADLVTHPYDSSYSKPPYVYHTDDPLHDTYWNDGFDATAGLCDSSIIFMQAFWYLTGSSGNAIHIFGYPGEAYGGAARNPEFTGDSTYNAFPGEIYLGNMSNPWFSRYITFDGNDVWRALSTEENNADWVELYSAHAPMYPPEPF